MVENKEVFEDRWLSWFFSAAFLIFFAVWGTAQYVIIQIEDDILWNSRFDSRISFNQGFSNLEIGGEASYVYKIPDKGSLLNIELEASGLLSDGSLVVSGRDGSIFYEANNGAGEEVNGIGRLTKKQMGALLGLIDENGFFFMEKSPSESKRVSAVPGYTITIRTISDFSEPVQPGVYRVTCGHFDCDKGFLEIKDKIIEFWGTAFICLDGCDMSVK